MLKKIQTFSFFRVLAILVFLTTLWTTAQAAVSPVGLSVMPPVQFPPEKFTVAGVRASVLWGHHQNVYGFDIGAIGNMTQQNFLGVGVAGGFNMTYGDTTILALQGAGITNINYQKTGVWGVQVAGGVNYNKAESYVVGLQIAALGNLADYTTIYGVQASLYNKAREVYGFQIGVVNIAENLHGLQIGLINFHNKGLFSMSPILNFGF